LETNRAAVDVNSDFILDVWTVKWTSFLEWFSHFFDTSFLL